ncbi:MAG: integration host factor subunit beta [Gammaproteobacteria bacterium]|jgi:integration host factor subunit beta|nr:integration host factor subunit beta [Gammaproteobacteria bacterium]
MIKSNLIEKIAAKQTKYSSEYMGVAVNKLIELLTDSLANGERIEIRGFGSFCLHFQSERMAHNPKTKQKITTKGKYRTYFKPGKELRDRVNRITKEKPLT